MFTYLLSIVVVSRLVYLRDGALGRAALAAVIVVQTAAVALLQPIVPVAVYVVLMAGLNIAFHRLERRATTTNGLRVLQLGIQTLFTAALSARAAGATFRPWLVAVPGLVTHYVGTLPQAIDLTNAGLVLLGFVLVSNEANLLIRYLLERIGLVTPLVSRKPPYLVSVGSSEYNAGRYIGILERLLIYILVLNAQFAVIGFVLAAKSFARFKQLEERQFAEYVLIGTLLSTLVAMLVSLLIRALIS